MNEPIARSDLILWLPWLDGSNVLPESQDNTRSDVEQPSTEKDLHSPRNLDDASSPPCLQSSLLVIESRGALAAYHWPERLGHNMSTECIDIGAVPSAWTRRHLLSLESLSTEEINLILDAAAAFRRSGGSDFNKASILSGKSVANLFFENSTRTRTSFSLAARRLGAQVVEFTVAGSSLTKGESFIDTAKNIEAMGIDVIVVRHGTPGTPQLLAQHVDCSVINAGDGPHEHPTQALLDILTVREQKGQIGGLTVALVGDIAHSRTARSNIWGLKKLGAHVILCGPSTLVSRRWEELGVEVCYSLDEVLPRCDVLNLLRIQFERQVTRPFPSVREYALLYGMTKERLARAKDDILILAPGPINRGVEVTPDVADGPHSVILEQVKNGLAVRMAVLWLLACGE